MSGVFFDARAVLREIQDAPPATSATSATESAKRSDCSNCSGAAALKIATPEPDIAAFEERAAIAEHDGGQSRDDAENLAAREQGFGDAADLHRTAVERWSAEIDRLAELGAIGPEGAEAIKRAQAFIGEGWALQAARLGWDELDLFGVCPRAPLQRLDRKGAAFGGAVQAISEAAVTYVGGLRRYRATINNDGGAVPIWALAEGILK